MLCCSGATGPKQEEELRTRGLLDAPFADVQDRGPGLAAKEIFLQGGLLSEPPEPRAVGRTEPWEALLDGSPREAGVSQLLEQSRRDLLDALDEWGQVFLNALNAALASRQDATPSLQARVPEPKMRGHVADAWSSPPSTSLATLGAPRARTLSASTARSDGSDIKQASLIIKENSVTSFQFPLASDTTSPPTFSSMEAEHTAEAEAKCHMEVSESEEQRSSKRGKGRPWRKKRNQQMILGPDGIASLDSLEDKQEPESELKKWGKSWVESQPFECVSAIAILLNTILIGTMSDMQMKNSGKDASGSEVPAWALHAEVGFTIFFTLEVAIKMLTYGVNFFRNEHWRWNLFDLGLVTQGLVSSIINSDDAVSNASFLRTLRVARILRILRIIRVLRGFRELRLITNSIMGSFKAMVWSMVLLFGVTYLFGTAFLQACTYFLETTQVTPEDEALVRRYWGSLTAAMLSLFKASTGGEDWTYIAEPLQRVSDLMYCIFLLYIAFFLFAVVNCITSLFVESTMHMACADNVMATNFEMQRKDAHIANLKQFFGRIDTDGDGRLSYEEFADKIQDKALQAFASSLGMDVHDTLSFFKTLSGSLNRQIDIETFVVGCIKLRGDAKAADMYFLFDEVKLLLGQLVRKLKEEGLLQDGTLTNQGILSTTSDVHTEVNLAI